MKTLTNLILLVAVFTLLLGCNDQDAPISSELAQMDPTNFAYVTTGSSDVLDYYNPTQVVGTSKLVRNSQGISLTLHTTGITPGDAVTVWWVIFNNPEACGGSPCGLADLGNPAVNASVLFAAGHVIGGGNSTSFASHLNVGDVSEALFGPGLLDPFNAEVHLVVRTHGPAIPGMVDEQIHEFAGGCPPNTCDDIQFSIHLP
jgi:hypothetical protein